MALQPFQSYGSKITVSPIVTGKIKVRETTPSERQMLTQRFGLGIQSGVSESFRPQDIPPAIRGSAFDSVKDPVTGKQFAGSSQRGQQIIADYIAKRAIVRTTPIDSVIAQKAPAVEAIKLAPPMKKPVPTGTRVGTRVSGGVTFAVVSQGPGKKGILVEEKAFLEQRAKDTARDLAVREAALGQQAIELQSKQKQLASRRVELERLSRSMTTPTVYFNKKLREFEALGGTFERDIGLRETLIGGFESEERKFERTEAKLAGIAEAERITGIITKREREGVPLEEKFGLEAAETVIVSKRLAAEARVFGAKLVGLPGQYALEKEKLREIERKAGFAAEGPAGFLGLTEGDIADFPVIAESLARKQRPGRERVRFLYESGDIIGAGIAAAELTGRKAVEVAIPPGKEYAPGLFLLPKEATPAISAIRGAFGLETLEAGQQFSFLGGTRAEQIAKGGLAGSTIAQFAALQVAFSGASAAVKFAKAGKKPSLGLGEAAIIGKTRKRGLPITKITKAESIRLRKLGVIVKPTTTPFKFPKTIEKPAPRIRGFEPTRAPASGTIAVTVQKGAEPVIISIPIKAVKELQRARTQEFIMRLGRGETLKGLTIPKQIKAVGKAKVTLPKIALKTKTIERISLAEKALLANVVLTKAQEKEIQKSALAFAQPQLFKQAESLREVTKETTREKQLAAFAFAPTQLLTSATAETEIQRERTAIKTIFDLPAITGQRFVPEARGRGISLKDVAFKEFAKPRQPRFRLPEFKVEKGITPKQTRALVEGFAIFVRRRGKFTRLGTRAYPKLAALSVGAKRVEETAAATFKIIPTEKRVKRSPLRDWERLQSRFRVGKGGAFVERRKFRISTPGELQEITFAPRRQKAIKSLIPSFKKSKGGLINL